MLFLAIILFVHQLIRLIKGRYFQGLYIKYGEEKIKNANGELSDEDFVPTKVAYGLILGINTIILLALEIPLLILGMSSPNRLIMYATTAFFVYMISFIVIGVIINKNKKGLDLTIEDEANKYRKKIYGNRSVSGTIITLINLSLYGFIIYELLS